MAHERRSQSRRQPRGGAPITPSHSGLALALDLVDWDTGCEMRAGVIVALVLLSFVATPVAMALDGCSGTGAMCAVPCSAPCTVTSVTMTPQIPASVSDLAAGTRARISPMPLNTLDAPPKSLLS